MGLHWSTHVPTRPNVLSSSCRCSETRSGSKGEHCILASAAGFGKRQWLPGVAVELEQHVELNRRAMVEGAAIEIAADLGGPQVEVHLIGGLGNVTRPQQVVASLQAGSFRPA